MRLIVADSRDHQSNLKRQHPDDKVVCVGDAVYGLRVSGIVNETAPYRVWRGVDADWWEHAYCRVEPSVVDVCTL